MDWLGWRIRREEVEAAEFSPPVIEACTDTNQHILQRVAATMLKRGYDDLDVILSDANEVTYSYCLGDLAFNPVSERANEILDQSGSNWCFGHLIVKPSSAETLIQELERSGLKVGVQLGYVQTPSDRWLQARQRRFASFCELGWSYPGFLVGVFFAVWVIKWRLGTDAFRSTGLLSWAGFCLAFAVFAGFLPKIILRPLGRVWKSRIEARIEKRDAARFESWKKHTTEWLNCAADRTDDARGPTAPD